MSKAKTIVFGLVIAVFTVGSLHTLASDQKSPMTWSIKAIVGSQTIQQDRATEVEFINGGVMYRGGNGLKSFISGPMIVSENK